MSVGKSLETPYHQQDTNYYCGAANAQMVLEEIGAGVLSQDDLYNDNHNHSVLEPGWYTAPDGLAWTLNNRKPDSVTDPFVVFGLEAEDAISRKICWTIEHYGVSACALVLGSLHWVVVRGYRASATPSASDDIGYTISDFWVNNPWPPVPEDVEAPPPHGDTDDCGTGGTRGIAFEQITYLQWRDTYMTGVSEGYWAGDFVAVCDPEPAATRVGESLNFASLHSGESIITVAEAVECAQIGFDLYELGSVDWFHDRFAQGLSPSEPILVQRLDRNDEYYYIVPFLGANQQTSILSCVDARYGSYLQTGAPRQPAGNNSIDAGAKPDIWQAPQRQHLHEALRGKSVDLGRKGGRLSLRPEVYAPYPSLVWRPCLESLSPFYPFVMIQNGENTVYMRLDGQVFTELTTDVRGV